MWASKALMFIKKNPVFHTDERGKAMIEYNFAQLKRRLSEPHLFQKDILGKQLQIFLLTFGKYTTKPLTVSTKLTTAPPYSSPS